MPRAACGAPSHHVSPAPTDRHRLSPLSAAVRIREPAVLGSPRFMRRLSLVSLLSVAALIATETSPAGSSLAYGQYEPGSRVAPGVFLAEVPEGGPTAERQAEAGEYQQRIVGGNTTTIAEWPWQAAVTLNPAF